MLSDRKALLFVAVCSAALGAVLAVGLAGAVHLGLLVPQVVSPFLGPILVLLCLAFIPAAVLQIEYAQALRGAEFKLFTEESLSIGQFLVSLRWCPTIVALVCFGLAVISFAMVWVGDMPLWSENEPLTVSGARAILGFQASFFLLALPIVLSGLRVPGSFRAQLAPEAARSCGTPQVSRGK